MVFKSFDGLRPQVHESAYIADSAVLLGDVVIERNASVWPNATLRGDDGRIHIGPETSVQDNCVFHEGPTVGENVTVGHNAIVHGCDVGDNCLIGMGSTVLTGAEVGDGSIVAAGAVVLQDETVPPNTLVAGVPAQPVRELDPSRRRGSDGESYYSKLATKHAETGQVLKRSQIEFVDEIQADPGQ